MGRGTQDFAGGVFFVLVADTFRPLLRQRRLEGVRGVFGDVSIGIDVEADECGAAGDNGVDGLLASEEAERKKRF